MVYFISNSDGKFTENSCVKVGHTKNSVKWRLRELQSGNPVKLTVLWKIEGDLSVEKEFHKLLAKYHKQGEWFKYNAEVENLISEYRVGKKKMGIRKLIYVSSEEIWKTIKAAAKKEGKSASSYLIQLHEKHIAEGSELGKRKNINPPDVKPLLKAKKATAPKSTWANPLANTTLAPKKGNE